MNISVDRPIRARINIIKLTLLFPILIFHAFLGLIGIENLSSEPKFDLWNKLFVLFGHEFFGSFGYYIICLSLFTYGYHFNSVKRKNYSYMALKIFILLACMLSSQIDLAKSYTEDGFFTWNLYSFILVILLLMAVLNKKIVQFPNYFFYFFVAAFALSPSLNWILRNHLHLHLNLVQALIPTQIGTFVNSWFLFPWVFGPLLFYVAAVGLRTQKLQLHHITMLILPILISIIYLSLFPTYHFPFSLEIDAFYRNFFWQNVGVDIIKVFSFCLLLLMFCSNYLRRIEDIKVFTWLRHLQWCKHFWFCYILHLGIKDLLATDYSDLLINPWVFNYSWLLLFVCSEILAQLFFGSLFVYTYMLRRLIPKLRVRKA